METDRSRTFEGIDLARRAVVAAAGRLTSPFRVPVDIRERYELHRQLLDLPKGAIIVEDAYVPTGAFASPWDESNQSPVEQHPIDQVIDGE